MQLESVNISAGGIFFRSNKAFDRDSKLIIRFTIPGQEAAVTSHCSVIHNLETIPGRQYFVGVRFDTLEGISQSRLNSLLSEQYD